VARLFGVRPPPELRPSLAGAEFEALRQEVEASVARWPEQPIQWEGRHARLSPERAAEFHRRLLDLIAEYWGGPPDRLAEEDATAPMLGFAAATYRHPIDDTTAAERPPDEDRDAIAGG
jgi:hypothetical protein